MAGRLLAPLILVAGLALGGGLALDAVWIHAKAILAQHLLERSWNAALAGEANPPPWPGADHFPVARLRVDRLNQDLVVLSGTDGSSLAFAPGHQPESVAPGEMGNSIISAHRDTHFRFLKDIRVGDAIEIEQPDGTARMYHVTALDVVHEDVARFYSDPSRAVLTLITCFPFDAVAPGGPLRYVVSAEAGEPGTG